MYLTGLSPQCARGRISLRAWGVVNVADDIFEEGYLFGQRRDLSDATFRYFVLQLRYKGTGPLSRKPTPRTVVYLETEVIEWIEATSRRQSCAAGAFGEGRS